ncbi:hypothetical protein TNCV_1627941 [Trichonephila clavipes]|nr:hypothetical protein TNCV_1627941 [Trichonephila clavipes]
MLEKVIENWTSRLDYIRASRGSPMPEIIFKMYFKILSPRQNIIENRTSGSSNEVELLKLFGVLDKEACLVIILWMAGGTSIKERREIFYQRSQSRMLFTGNAEEPRIERWLLDKPEFVFTGWDIVSYGRNIVFAVLGTLITYSVVVNK